MPLTLEQAFNMKKIRYDLFDNTINTYLDKDTEELNLIFDLEFLIKELFSDDIMKLYNTSNAKITYFIVSEIFNIAAHYRHYYFSRYRIKTNIFFVHTINENNRCLKIYKDYKQEIYERYKSKTAFIKNLIMNINLVNIIADYLPNIYFIDSNNIDELFAMKYIIFDSVNKKEQNIMNLIFTNNPIYFSLTSNETVLCINNRVDNIKIYEKWNLINDYIANKSKTDKELHPSFYKFIITIAGYKKFNIPAVKSMYGNIKSYKKIVKLIEKNIIVNMPYNFKTFTDAIKQDKFFTDNIIKNFNRNYELMFHKFTNEEILNNIKLIERKIINNYDSKLLKYYNETYFEHNPINFDYIMDGQAYYK